MIYLESGGGCSTQEGCEARYDTSRILMSSSWLDEAKHEEIRGRDILSGDADVNPFSEYNHVYVPYCTSDMYVGMGVKGSAWSKTSKNFVFAGYHVVNELMKELKGTHLAAGMTEVVLAGSSAGGIGVLNHIAHIKLLLPYSNVRGIVDSSWFINYENNFNKLWDFEQAQILTDYKSFPKPGTADPGFCSTEYAGMPCCFQASHFSFITFYGHPGNGWRRAPDSILILPVIFYLKRYRLEAFIVFPSVIFVTAS